MELIKKNLGLIIAGVICLALSGFVVVRMAKAGKNVSESFAKVEEQLQFFKGVKQKNIKLNKENVRAAEDNQAIAEKKFLELRQQLAAKSHIDAKPPATALDCLRQLQVEIERLHEKCRQANLMVPAQYMFSFERVAMSRKLPAAGDVPAIFRQLRIVQEVVRILGKAEIDALVSLDRPMGLQVLEEDLYTMTPIQLVIMGQATEIQHFVNMMSTESAYLFFLRKMSLQSQDQAPGGLLAGITGGEGGRSGARGDMMMGMGGIEMGGAGMGGIGMGGVGMGGMGMGGIEMGGAGMGGMGMQPEMMEGGMGQGGTQQDMGQMLLTRERLIAFEKRRQVTADLRFDLIEFLTPSEEE